MIFLVSQSYFKVALYSFFDAREIGTNGASARVLKRISTLMTSLKTRVFYIHLKTHIMGEFHKVIFFHKWHMDSLFLSLAVWEKSPIFTHTLM